MAKNDPDHVHLLGHTSDGGAAFVRCRPDGTHDAGVLRPAREGEPLYDGALRLEHHEGDIYNVVDEFRRETPKSEPHSGPAMVNSEAYRDGWDSIFGKQPVGQA